MNNKHILASEELYGQTKTPTKLQGEGLKGRQRLALETLCVKEVAGKFQT